MGKLYYYNKVYPYWLIQHSAFDSFKRGWIFQESRFPEIHPYLLIDHAWIIDSPIFHQLIQYRTGLTNITRNHPFSQFLKKRNYQPDFIDVLYSYLNCELSYESDLDNAIFGVLKEDRDVLNNLPYNGIITTMTVRSHRFNRVFGSSKEYFCFAGEKYLQFIVSEDRSKVQVVHYTISTGQVSSESKQKTETALDSVERCEYLFENGMILEYYKPNENKERMYLPE